MHGREYIRNDDKAASRLAPKGDDLRRCDPAVTRRESERPCPPGRVPGRLASEDDDPAYSARQCRDCRPSPDVGARIQNDPDPTAGVSVNVRRPAMSMGPNPIMGQVFGYFYVENFVTRW